MIKIPRAMSTQHPDNVNSPFFSENGELHGEDEVKEAYYAFAQLGCDEQMWDCEGKEIDNYVVKKLLARYPWFKERKLGQDVFITLRVPNPEVEEAEAKILLETLESIPRSYDAAKLIYGEDIAPIFEVILPMATSALGLNRIYSYYRDFVVGKKDQCFVADVTIREWIGDFFPERINVIPLFEDRDSMLASADVLREYLSDKDLPWQRVFFARSDPAMNYGLVSAVLLNKLALAKTHDLASELEIPIYPILGVGSAPFRGNLTPLAVDRVLAEYPSVHTFTVQSAFKYDYFPEQVLSAISKLKNHQVQAPIPVDEKLALDIIDKGAATFQHQVASLAGAINRTAPFVPRRRKRKLHTGQFGYARQTGKVSLPRAINFTAALYSLGMPPELLALDSYTEEDLQFIRSVYINFDADIADALRFFNPESPYVPRQLRRKLYRLLDSVEIEPHQEHQELTDYIVRALAADKTDSIPELVLAAARLRGFLG